MVERKIRHQIYVQSRSGQTVYRTGYRASNKVAHPHIFEDFHQNLRSSENSGCVHTVFLPSR